MTLEQLVDGSWIKITEALFVLVARDPLNRDAAFLNPLELVTEEEKVLFKNGEENKKRYKIVYLLLIYSLISGDTKYHRILCSKFLQLWRKKTSYTISLSTLLIIKPCHSEPE